jgi:hypothetical protein
VRRARRKRSPGSLLSGDAPPRPGGAQGGEGGRLPRAEGGDFPFQIYFTSGTTGTPKRVELTHHQIVSHAMGVCRESRLRGGDCWGHFAPIFHLVDAFAMFALTRVGGRHVFLPKFDALSCFRVVEREGVTCSNVASTMLTLMVNSPAAAFFDISTLRLLSCGGSHQSPAVVRKAFSLLGCEFFISYGMTECCGKLTMSILPAARAALPEAEQLARVCTSGRPYIGMEVRVVGQGDGGDVVPNGRHVGEVVCKGFTVFHGYKGEFSGRSFNGGWFCTGDLATVDANGQISIVDRCKDMILCGGENVYCTEVENALMAHPAVKLAAVFGVPDAIMGEAVYAAVATTTDVSARELREHCGEALSAFKVPSKFFLDDHLPLTGSGKVKKTALRDRYAGQGAIPSQGGNGGSAPSGAEGEAMDFLANLCDGFPSERLEGLPALESFGGAPNTTVVAGRGGQIKAFCQALDAGRGGRRIALVLEDLPSVGDRALLGECAGRGGHDVRVIAAGRRGGRRSYQLLRRGAGTGRLRHGRAAPRLQAPRGGGHRQL